jgi:hypothetical protein
MATIKQRRGQLAATMRQMERMANTSHDLQDRQAAARIASIMRQMIAVYDTMIDGTATADAAARLEELKAELTAAKQERQRIKARNRAFDREAMRNYGGWNESEYFAAHYSAPLKIAGVRI